jgi:signal transduction histidine kinase/CheY-like chemotaxis protein
MTTADLPLPASSWRRLLMPLICVVLVAASLWWAHRLTIDAAGWPGLRLTQAEAWSTDKVDDERPPPGAPWQPVTLPDNWKVSRPQGAGSVWYRIRFDRPPGETPAVLIPRLATSGQVFLNGSRLWDSRSRDPGATRSWNAPLLLVLPAGLLQPTGNVLHVQVSGLPRYRAGLSELQVGSLAELYPPHEWRRFWQHDGAMLSCAISLVAGVLMLLAWLRMREDGSYLFFGLATLFWAARNSNLFLDRLPITIDAWAVVVHTGHIWFNVMFGLFVLRFTQTRWPRFERVLWGYGLLNSGTMLLGGMLDIEPVLRAMVLPGVALFVLLVALLLRKGWRDRSVESALIAATTLTFVVLSLRDGLLLSSRLPYDAYYISHYTGVLMLVSIAWGMVARLERALRSVEQLNVTLESRVQERTLSLEQANAAKTRFLAAASHDLRQPVVAIGLLAGLLREQLAGPALSGFADRLVLAVGSLEAMLKGLLDVSRLDSGTFKPERQPVPVQAVFDAIALHEAEAAQAKGLRLRWRPTPLVVASDRVVLEQILRNLVSNAVRYTDHGGVLVAARRRGAQVLLQVWDTGRGIAEAQQDEVFEEFVQLGNPQRSRAQGLGLGLAIVRRGAALLGAPLRLRSRVGRGSCFSILVPAASAQAMPASPLPHTAASLAGLSIVVVEDDPAVCRALADRLESWGARVAAFEHPAALFRALDDPAASLPAADLLISDQRLPGSSGIEVVARLRERLGAGLPALLITGDTAPHDLAALAASGLPVLHKPFSADELLRAIEAACLFRAAARSSDPPSSAARPATAPARSVR